MRCTLYTPVDQTTPVEPLLTFHHPFVLIQPTRAVTDYFFRAETPEGGLVLPGAAKPAERLRLAVSM